MMGWDYPPGVSGNEPEITGDRPMTFDDFVREYGIEMEATPATSNERGEWPEGTAHWTCKLSCKDRDMIVPFSMGAGLRHWTQKGIRMLRRYDDKRGRIGGRAEKPFGVVKGYLDEAWKEGTAPDEPTTEDVLSCLAMDAQTADNSRSFEDWAEELGLDPDSRSAERTYIAVCKHASDLAKLVGEWAYAELLDCEEA